MSQSKFTLYRVFKFQIKETIGQTFSNSLCYLILFIFLFSLNCSEKKPDSDPSATIGLLGINAGTQTDQGSNDGKPGEVLPPIPPVVGPPAAPGQPLNAPVLNNPQNQVTEAPLAQDQYKIYGKILVNNISFQQPVHNQTTITAYMGRRNLKLEPDGTVVNALEFRTLTPGNPNPDGNLWFSFLHRSNEKYRLLLVARNEFGSSSKEINFFHNRDCIGAPLAPATVGDCNDHCMGASLVGAQMEFHAKYRHPGDIGHLWLDISGYSPRGGAPILESNVTTYDFDPAQPPLPPGFQSVTTTMFEHGKHHMCVELQSFIFFEDGNGFHQNLLVDKMRLE
ncbi:hypothetical protein [Leptospira terpstrae]|uniref:Uncharacterized protein n=1 Tax=Leptospira terpstrae serovar Hualin str. LT 11-33 = ATCC 700639 TaxID=1257025 RepID=N1VRP0_9LEPT|nr:hypothetical protein [Leptospira terpstrae]EMY62374.1 hypothetical protein LEP1GSC203_2212 [Leptospira terpstrae serovar Hualin str. LT 11-33 = ATCC 700639]